MRPRSRLGTRRAERMGVVSRWATTVVPGAAGAGSWAAAGRTPASTASAAAASTAGAREARDGREGIRVTLGNAEPRVVAPAAWRGWPTSRATLAPAAVAPDVGQGGHGAVRGRVAVPAARPDGAHRRVVRHGHGQLGGHQDRLAQLVDQLRGGDGVALLLAVVEGHDPLQSVVGV